MADRMPDLPEHVDVLIVGAGQAGLGAAQQLETRPGLRVLVVDQAPVGQSWLDRWDSLVLFTPRRFSSLPGLPFPSGPTRCPTRVEMAAYLRDYAAHHRLPVHTGVRVERLTGGPRDFVAQTSAGTVRARHVVLASGPFRRPHLPAAAGRLGPQVRQLHSQQYRRPADITPGHVLVVGGGNSAAQLAVELSTTHGVTVAAPRPPWFLPVSLLGADLYWWTYLTGVLNADRDAAVSRYVRSRGDAIVGQELRDRARDGAVRLIPHRLVDADGDTVWLADGTQVTVETVLWCTGFRADTSWIEVPCAVDRDGTPRHHRGASLVAGLHWIGLPWQTRLNSSIINGVHRDAKALADRIDADVDR